MARSSADRISKLPNDVRIRILMFLPLKEAAKSSVLSFKWWNLWTKLPSLVVDESFSDMELQPRGVVDKLMLNVYRVLLLHGGNLKGFSLSHSMLRYQTYHIMRLLPYRNLENLTVDTGGFYKLPIRVFWEFFKLKTLRLSMCKFTFSPVSFYGFHRLTDLELRSVRFEKNLAQLRVKCPLLITLIIDGCGSYHQRPIIVIESAPNLSSFHFDGSFVSLRLEHTPRLKDVIIHNKNQWYQMSKGTKFGPALLKRNGGLAAVESLHVSFRTFYEYVAPGQSTQYLEDVSQRWKKLRHLRLDNVLLYSTRIFWFVVCMIVGSPNLQQLSIQMSDFLLMNRVGSDAYNEAIGKYEPSRMMTRVELKTIRGGSNQMTLIRWLLDTCPTLEEMKIQFSSTLSDAEKLLIVAELNGFQRASSRAQIIFQNVTSSKALN